MQRPFALWLLIFCLLFLSLGGLYGGIAMLADPTGDLLQLTELLLLLPVRDFTLPGLFLFSVMGLLPLLLVYGLLMRPKWAWADKLSRSGRHHWAWTGALALGITLIAWLAAQGLLIGFKWPIQYITGVDGLLIILFALVPRVRQVYSQ